MSDAASHHSFLLAGVARAACGQKYSVYFNRLPPLDDKREPDRHVFFAVAAARPLQGSRSPNSSRSALAEAGRGCSALQAGRVFRGLTWKAYREEIRRCGGLLAHGLRPARIAIKTCDHRYLLVDRSHLHRRHPVRHLSDQLAGSGICHAPVGRTHLRGSGHLDRLLAAEAAENRRS